MQAAQARDDRHELQDEVTINAPTTAAAELRDTVDSSSPIAATAARGRR